MKSDQRKKERQEKVEAAYAEGKVPARFVAVQKGVEGASDDPVRWGMYDREQKGDNKFITNFILEIGEDIAVLDDIESQRVFKGKFTIIGRTVPFRINAEDFADNNKLKAAIFQAGGPEVQIHCRMDELRTAISAISGLKPIQRREITTNFGWNKKLNSAELEFLVPSGRITASGLQPVDDVSSVRVDLGDEEQARFLDMRALGKEELQQVKRHIIDALLPLHDRTVTYSLLAASACSILQQFAPGVGRFALWLVGLTGSGKSFLSKLFMNFFGDFPVSSGRFATWSSTPNYVQRLGYFFKDALYLVDDYKSEVIPQYSIIRILQTYADGTARGRLKSDATTNTSRPIRALLISTGEDVPEHSASAMARSLVIKVPQREKDLVRGNRCIAECRNYAGVTADFIAWLIANKKTAVFGDRVVALQQRFYSDVAGQQNDSRIATNLALLGAAFELIAEYFSDVWPESATEAKRFIEEDLLAIRGDMLGEVKDQQASEVFLHTLGELVQFKHVRIDGMSGQGQEMTNKPFIGRVASTRRGPLGVQVPGPDQDRLEICTSLALSEVNKCLQQQGRPLLRVTESALLQQLREDGKLVDANGQPLEPGADLTRRARLGGSQVRVFSINRKVLIGE